MRPGWQDEDELRRVALFDNRLAGLRIGRLADERGIMRAHVADRGGVGRTTIWRLLDVNDQGPSDPRLSTLSRLAYALGVPLRRLFEPPTAEERRALGLPTVEADELADEAHDAHDAHDAADRYAQWADREVGS